MPFPSQKNQGQDQGEHRNTGSQTYAFHPEAHSQFIHIKVRKAMIVFRESGGSLHDGWAKHILACRDVMVCTQTSSNHKLNLKPNQIWLNHGSVCIWFRASLVLVQYFVGCSGPWFKLNWTAKLLNQSCSRTAHIPVSIVHLVLGLCCLVSITMQQMSHCLLFSVQVCSKLLGAA